MLIFADGYSIFVLFFFDVTALNNVNVPTFPANIRKININLPQTFKSGVIPVETPTVANADTVSKSRFETEIFGADKDRKNKILKYMKH